jgi:hypothetical protein
MSVSALYRTVIVTRQVPGTYLPGSSYNITYVKTWAECVEACALACRVCVSINAAMASLTARGGGARLTIERTALMERRQQNYCWVRRFGLTSKLRAALASRMYSISMSGWQGSALNDKESSNFTI